MNNEIFAEKFEDLGVHFSSKDAPLWTNEWQPLLVVNRGSLFDPLGDISVY